MIDAALVQQIADCYGTCRNSPAASTYLRERFPQIRFTHCNDDEVGRATPVMVCAGFNIYLVGGDHCLELTGSYANAKGVVLAEVADEV